MAVAWTAYTTSLLPARLAGSPQQAFGPPACLRVEGGPSEASLSPHSPFNTFSPAYLLCTLEVYLRQNILIKETKTRRAPAGSLTPPSSRYYFLRVPEEANSSLKPTGLGAWRRGPCCCVLNTAMSGGKGAVGRLRASSDV
eukprot:scaffold14720_cov29-Tisochrysis_lutea.AAC.1